MSLSLMPADVVLVRSEGIVAKGIRLFSRSRNEKPTRVNHAALSVAGLSYLQLVAGVDKGVDVIPHLGVSDLIVDAQPPRVTLESLTKRYSGGELVAVYRSLELSMDERVAIAQYALRYVGDKYGFSKILLHAVGLERFSFIEERPICSYVVATPYSQVRGWTFGAPDNEAKPDDIDDFVVMNNSGYECIRELSPLEVRT